MCTLTLPRTRCARVVYLEEKTLPDEGLKTTFWKWVMKWYPAIRNTTTPFTALSKPLSACRVALVTSCGVHLQADPPFDLSDRRGDPSYRAIPSGVEPAMLGITHAHYNHRDALLDINVVLPIERLAELAREGIIGEVAPRHFGFMGSIPLPGRLIRRTAPEVARQLSADAVDIVLLTPC